MSFQFCIYNDTCFHAYSITNEKYIQKVNLIKLFAKQFVIDR